MNDELQALLASVDEECERCEVAIREIFGGRGSDNIGAAWEEYDKITGLLRRLAQLARDQAAILHDLCEDLSRSGGYTAGVEDGEREGARKARRAALALIPVEEVGRIVPQAAVEQKVSIRHSQRIAPPGSRFECFLEWLTLPVLYFALAVIGAISTIVVFVFGPRIYLFLTVFVTVSCSVIGLLALWIRRKVKSHQDVAR